MSFQVQVFGKATMPAAPEKQSGNDPAVEAENPATIEDPEIPKELPEKHAVPSRAFASSCMNTESIVLDSSCMDTQSTVIDNASIQLVEDCQQPAHSEKTVGAIPTTASVASVATAMGDRFKTEAHNAWTSDWIKALIIGPVFAFIPLLVLGDRVVQCFLRLSGSAKTDDAQTQRGRSIIDWFCELDVSAILVRICVLGEVIAFTFNVLFAKLTYIFLSWLNAALASLSFPAVCILVVFVGLCMFLLPPVPGVPVYVFSGIVITTQAQRPGVTLGFEGAIVLACVLSLMTKLVACVGQYFIGVFMGRSIKVQQLIGVDRPPTRAIEKIVSQKGVQPSKVFVLIGGPDWPVSVTCGILRVNVPQMLLGTLPVVVILTPCVIAGAALTRVSGGADDPWVNKSRLAILAATLGQGGSLLAALVFIFRTVAADRRELSKPRPEHQRVEELTRQEKEYDDKYVEITKWNGMTWVQQAIISVATFLQLVSNTVLTVYDSKCFRPFFLSSKIGDHWDAYPPGLRGDPLSILLPAAFPVLGAFLAGTLLHIFYVKHKERRATALLKARKGERPRRGSTE